MKIQTMLLGALLSVSAPVVVAETDLDAAIKYRQGVYRAMEWNLTRMAAMAQGRVAFDEADFARRADRIALLGQIVPEGFVQQSPRGDVVRTRASYRIWEARERFDGLMSDMQARSRALQQATAVGAERDDLRPLVGRLAQSCKACHDKFRD